MDGFINSIISLFAFWGAWLGLIVAALTAWILSSLFWDEFNVAVFIGAAIPCLIGGVYLQHVLEKDS